MLLDRATVFRRNETLLLSNAPLAILLVSKKPLIQRGRTQGLSFDPFGRRRNVSGMGSALGLRVGLLRGGEGFGFCRAFNDGKGCLGTGGRGDSSFYDLSFGKEHSFSGVNNLSAGGGRERGRQNLADNRVNDMGKIVLDNGDGVGGSGRRAGRGYNGGS